MSKAQCKDCGNILFYTKTRSTRLRNLPACQCGARKWIKPSESAKDKTGREHR